MALFLAVLPLILVVVFGLCYGHSAISWLFLLQSTFMLLAAVIAGGEFPFKAANSLFFGKRRASLAVFVKSVCIRFQVFLVGPSFHLRRIGSYMSGSRGVATCSCSPSS